MKQRLKELCELSGVSGREEAVREYILRVLRDTPTEKEVSVDALGNIICHIKGRQRASKKLLLTAHMDEVGLIITHITDEGYLRFACVGGIESSVLCGKRVKIGDTVGVIGCKAIHLCSKEEAEKQPKPQDLLIDIGVSSVEEAMHLVSPGDIAVFDTPFSDMQNLILSKALDDRVGCALLLELAQATPLYDISLAFTVQEEVGLRGAGPVAFAIQPDISVTVEATTAADIAETDGDKQVCKVGNGPVVSFMDKATLYDNKIYTDVRRLADDMHIPNQTKSVIAGGNDAGAIQKSARGVRVCAISVPCRYIHSPSSAISYTDMEYARQLLLKLIEVLPQ